MQTQISDTQQFPSLTTTDLFTPLKLGPYTLPNRIVMAPLTRNRAGTRNVPQAINTKYYTQRASAGLIITEGTQISPQGVGYPHTPGIHTEEQVDGWRHITQAVHARGSRIFLQLWHVGRISHPSLQPNGALPVAPSSIKPTGQAITYEGMKPFVTPRALDISEIPQIIEQFAWAATNAKKAGFDGVEIHAANGYLLDQFLRDGSNHRTDGYGGSVANRTRLLLEVTDAVTSVWDSSRVGIRLSPLNSFNDMFDSQPHVTFPFVVDQLRSKNLGYLHMVENTFGEEEPAGFMDWATLRGRFGGMYIANGGYDLETAITAIKTQRADLVSFGSLFIANPDLPIRFATGASLNVPDRSTFYGGTHKGYTDYPFLTHRTET